VADLLTLVPLDGANNEQSENTDTISRHAKFWVQHLSTTSKLSWSNL